MKLKALFAFIIMFAAGCAASNAQNVDYNAIEVDVKMNPARYRSLLDRFMQADTTLTVPELQTVYYGYSFTPDYDPRDNFPAVMTAYDNKDYEATATLAGTALEVNPMSLDLYVMALTAAENGAGDRPGHHALSLGIRCDMIATAIMESGRGTTASSPFYVISSTDISRILNNVLGIAAIVDRTKVGPVDAIKVTFPGSDRQHIIYFDNTREEQFLSSHK